MKTLAPCLAVTLALMTGALAQAQHQPGMSGPIGPPVVSPYLNLSVGTRSPAINYFGIVRPQIEFRNALRGLQQGLNEQAAADLTAIQDARATGHQAYFNNLGHYYNNNPAAPGGTRGSSSSRTNLSAGAAGTRAPAASAGAAPQPRR